MHPWIFRVQFNSTHQQRHRLFVSPQLHQQTSQIVIRRKTFRVELNRGSQQAFRFDVFSTLTRDIAEVRERVRVVRLKFQSLTKRGDCLVEQKKGKVRLRAIIAMSYTDGQVKGIKYYIGDHILYNYIDPKSN